MNQILSKIPNNEFMEKNFEKHKLKIFKLAIPSENH